MMMNLRRLVDNMADVPFRNPNEVYFRRAEDLTELGYKTGEIITLPETGISIDLGGDFYRSLGPFESASELVESAIRTYQEQGLARESAVALALSKKLSHGNPKLEGGYVLPHRFHVNGRISQVVSKATTVQPIEAVRVYVEAHEEGHVVDHLKRPEVLKPWFTDKGFANLDVRRKLVGNENPEYLACAVGLATLLSRGIPLEDARILTDQDIRRDIHAELLPLLQEENEDDS